MSFADFWRHTAALTLKETRQIVRDKSAFLLGIVMPVVLIILFGYGLSFDIRDVRLGIAQEAKTGEAQALTTALTHNPVFKTTVFTSRAEGEKALKAFDVEALLVLETRRGATAAQLLIDGIDAPRAVMIGNAVTVAAMIARVKNSQAAGAATVPRIWFNESAESRRYLVPGLMVIVLTMTGMMLTGLVLAREWERGTMEALIATPASPLAILISKVLPYFVLGLVGWGLCLFAALFLYDVPVRGSLTVITVSSALYLLIGLGLGLFVSGVT